MADKKRLQKTITTGRLTLPVAIFLSIALWIVAYFIHLQPDNLQQWGCLSALIPGYQIGMLINFILYALTGYALIELNNTFSIIRIRASIQTSFYYILVAVCPFLHPLNAGIIVALCLVGSIYFLFKSYQQIEPVNELFYSFSFLGIGSLAFPQLLFFTPIFLIGTYQCKALTTRTFFASLIGLSTPYWFLLGHAFFYHQMELFYNHFQELIQFKSLQSLQLSIEQYIMAGYGLIILAISMVHSIITSHQDKIRTRVYLYFLIQLEIVCLLFLFLQPQHLLELLSILILVGSILVAHLFALTNNKASNILFIISLISLIACFYYNLWMHL